MTKLRSTDPTNDDNLVGHFESSPEMDHFPAGYRPSLRSYYEHGQWWIIDSPSGASWSVVDAEDRTDDEYYDFELVSHGDEDAMECEHEYGPVEHARFTGNPHRRCIHCRQITLDLDDDDEDWEDEEE